MFSDNSKNQTTTPMLQLEDGCSFITCQDDISFEKGHHRTYVADEVWDLVDHILCPTLLSYLIINLSQRLKSYKKRLKNSFIVTTEQEEPNLKPEFQVIGINHHCLW